MILKLERFDLRRTRLCNTFASKCTKSTKHVAMFPLNNAPIHNKKYLDSTCNTSRYYNSSIPYITRLLKNPTVYYYVFQLLKVSVAKLSLYHLIKSLYKAWFDYAFILPFGSITQRRAVSVDSAFARRIETPSQEPLHELSNSCMKIVLVFHQKLIGSIISINQSCCFKRREPLMNWLCQSYRPSEIFCWYMIYKSL